MREIIRLAVLGLAVSAFASAVDAKDKKKKKEPESHPTVITAVTPTAISIREAKIEKSVPITPSTEIYVRNQKASLGALQPGMAVSITLAMDGDTASRINAADPPVTRETKAGKPKDGKRKKSD